MSYRKEIFNKQLRVLRKCNTQRVVKHLGSCRMIPPFKKGQLAKVVDGNKIHKGKIVLILNAYIAQPVWSDKQIYCVDILMDRQIYHETSVEWFNAVK